MRKGKPSKKNGIDSKNSEKVQQIVSRKSGER